jgi:threonine dehydrogenase-like Zn-dependent dehydrogenase
VTPAVTHTVEWQDYEQAYLAMKSGQAGKVVLDFTSLN